ncbi:hypothetical protein D7V93_34490 [Corallococcus llansteffanensis]|uniref:Uncharacterized protein n=1 Tax=Corallococcus llansteffanensis TaxID=2316731 RepID=A0A3A8NTI6_9BACT|nr:hypothetical protein D7V93_34490 [Corallococcus llansteffanensis]
MRSASDTAASEAGSGAQAVSTGGTSSSGGGSSSGVSSSGGGGSTGGGEVSGVSSGGDVTGGVSSPGGVTIPGSFDGAEAPGLHATRHAATHATGRYRRPIPSPCAASTVAHVLRRDGDECGRAPGRASHRRAACLPPCSGARSPLDTAPGRTDYQGTSVPS